MLVFKLFTTRKIIFFTCCFKSKDKKENGMNLLSVLNLSSLVTNSSWDNCHNLLKSRKKIPSESWMDTKVPPQFLKRILTTDSIRKTCSTGPGINNHNLLNCRKLILILAKLLKKNITSFPKIQPKLTLSTKHQATYTRLRIIIKKITAYGTRHKSFWTVLLYLTSKVWTGSTSHQMIKRTRDKGLRKRASTRCIMLELKIGLNLLPMIRNILLTRYQGTKNNSQNCQLSQKPFNQHHK